MKVLTLSAAATLALAAVSAVQAATGDRTCRNGIFPREQDVFGLARVTGAGRLVFQNDGDGCPGAAPACAGRAYVTPGDVVLAGRPLGPYVCAFYPNRVGGTAGWVDRARLSLVPTAPAPPLSAWAGRWREGDDEIRLKVRGDRLKADGDAYWPSADPPLSVRPGGPNIGELQAEARPVGNRLRLVMGGGPDDCAADLWLLGAYLVVRDNGSCGGMNVTFTGVYRRR